jgi:hypothetical protein
MTTPRTFRFYTWRIKSGGYFLRLTTLPIPALWVGTINENGVNPGLDDALAVAKCIGLNTNKAKKTAIEIRECVNDMLSEYLVLV